MFVGKSLQCIKIIEGGTGHDLASFWPVNPFASEKLKNTNKVSMRLAGACSQYKDLYQSISGVFRTRIQEQIHNWDEISFRKVHLGAKNTIKLIDKMSLGADTLKVEGLIEKKGSIALEVTMATNTVWNSLCHGPDITRNEPVFFWKTEIWRDIGFWTRSVYIEYQDSYSFWIELFPRHGISDVRTRHWNAACQDL